MTNEAAAQAQAKAQAQAALLPPGSVVPVVPGRLSEAYDVQKAVGKGGYAIVYKGVRKEDGRIIAVKKVEIFEMSQKKRERCLQEVTLLQQLTHPYIIQMVDAFIDENMLIIIFEWAPAGDLKRLIKKTAEAGKTLDEPAIWGFFAQVTDALRYMHQHRIMHRDIKPANILVGANGALKLADLGLGRQLSEQTMEAFSKVGTPYYVSPEVVRGAGYDWKSDVWSMGCLLYELALLRSPFEMEGANLYDVFQKISKGEFSPLPADQFSQPLRQLVVRMLQIDPAKRPELDEVWAITKAVIESQSKSRVDVHSVSEDIFAQLALLESEVVFRLSNAANGKRNAALAPPPMDTLRLLHPLCFAVPTLGAVGDINLDELQKRQLGVFMHIFAWAVRLSNKPDLATAIEAHLQMIPTKWSTRQPTPSTDKPGSSSRKTRAGTKAGAASTSSAPFVPATIPSCTNLLKGAEATKKAAQALGLGTEFASVNALASGHGRAVCMLLQELLEKTCGTLQVVARPPKYSSADAAQAEPEAEEADEEIEGAEADLMGAGAAGGTGAASDDGEEAPLYGPSSGDVARAAASLGGGASTSGGGAGAGGGTKVDPEKWRAECERLGPLLSKIRVNAADMAGDWHHRWDQLKASLQSLQTDSPPLATSLLKVRGSVLHDLERIETTEARLNSSNNRHLEQYRSVRLQLEAAQLERGKHDELVELGNHALSELNGQIEEVNLSIRDKTDGLDGSRHVVLIRDAIRKLQEELRGMGVRIGVLQTQVMTRNRGRSMALIAGHHAFSDDDDD